MNIDAIRNVDNFAAHLLSSTSTALNKKLAEASKPRWSIPNRELVNLFLLIIELVFSLVQHKIVAEIENIMLGNEPIDKE